MLGCKALRFFGVVTFLLSVLFLQTGCELTDEEQSALDTALNPPVSPPENGNNPPLGNLCHAETFRQPDAEIIKKIDLLYVIDTSGSLAEERDQVAAGVDAFMNALPGDVDAQFAVMLGHVTETHTGRLYRKGNNWPHVMSTTEHNIADIKNVLRDRMTYPPSESASDGGESGLYSLSQGLVGSKLQDSKAQGFFRDDAALVVVFVADENDICARYPEGVDRVYDPNKIELPAFDQYCGDVTPESTLAILREAMGERPSLVSGVIYNNLSQIPNGGENEIGYGYLEMINAANGATVDLGGGQFNEGLEKIGQLAVKKLNLKSEFQLSGQDFDIGSLEVFVDTQKVHFGYNPALNEIQLTDDLGVENSEIYVTYCDFPVGENNPTRIFNVSVFEVTSTSVTLTWQTDLESNSQVEYIDTTNDNTQFSDVNSSGSFTHSVTITGLRPNTIYTLRAISSSIVGQDLPTYSDALSVRTRRAN